LKHHRVVVSSLIAATLATASGEARAAVLVEAVADGGSFSSITIGDGGGPDDFFRNILERSWTQSGAYEAVSIYTAVYAVSGTTTSTGGNAYLTDAIGPGTASLIASNSFSFPTYADEAFGRVASTADPLLLFSGLSLPAGTYHLVIAADEPVLAAWTTLLGGASVSAPDVTADDDSFYYSNVSTGGQNFAFPPASSFGVSGGAIYGFRVVGEPVPEPSGWATGLAALAVLAHRARRETSDARSRVP
jgi:MYXO-CTERM domain-containing protein